jgi:hypothetical protein
MADYTTIDNPRLFFNTVLYTGNGTAIGSGGNAITGVGFQPDFLWIKNRSSALHHGVFDVVRGTPKRVLTSSTAVEDSNAETVNSFDADGFTVGSNSNVNGSGNNLVAWNWLGANGTVSNSDGSISSTVSANQTAGFSVVTYTSNSTSSNETVGHGLGVKPDMVITKNRDTAYNWDIYHSSLGYNANLTFTTDATRSGAFGTSEPTSTVFRTSPSFTTNSTDKYVAYCFAGKQGYSKFGSYTGNGNADGPFIYTGFKPAWFLLKNSSASGYNWYIMDNKRDTDNPLGDLLLADSNAGTNTVSSERFDLLSNGFKVRRNDNGSNTSGSTYIYMAFAESPFVNSKGVPTNAR